MTADIDNALTEEIAAKVRAAGTSFYSAMRLLAPDRRNAMYAIYAFCREVDDIADDDGLTDQERHRRLTEWRIEIDRLYRGEPQHPVARALFPYMQMFDLRRDDFIAVIDGMEMDAVVIQAPSLAELDLYCDRVASAVGRLSVRAFGTREPQADTVAHHLGRALQLTNILRDLSEDASRDRLYLPREVLQQHGIDATQPQAVLKHPNLRAVCRDMAAKAENHFVKAQAAMRQCSKQAMRPAAVMGAMYHAILDKLIAADWRDLTQPVSVPKWRKLWIALRYGFL
ncbi:presqualene diphosphate synthase HpnD [Dongia soli]|uniref:Presqualene diphosphate synthase HpnD n=1 Tax=Dongia soli TaxID=600628 RepID=A0ABU5EJ21_9PROT|nr:presqualene diphosphate synthase HpnD [Dongia soli]MDY0885759.1 presqualene diphosphate synthase HpnD [Dongia soli]